MPLNIGGTNIESINARLVNGTSPVNDNLSDLWDPGLFNPYFTSNNILNSFTSTGRYWNFVNGPTYTTVGGGSILFDGANDYLEYGNSSVWSLSPPFTMHFWIRTSVDYGGLMSHYSGGPVNSGMFIQSGKLAYAYYNGDWRYNYSTGTRVDNNVWNLVTYASPASSSGTIVTYVNGIADWSFTVTGGHFGSNVGSIGLLWGFAPFNGYIAQIAHYNIQQSASQVLQFFNSTRQRFRV
jgi:hypothetical protein